MRTQISREEARAKAYEKAKSYGEEVKRAAKGKWDCVFNALAGPVLAPALARGTRHGPCPRHGGTDGFRFYKDYKETGGSTCNTCGHFADGFATLNFIYGWTFVESIRQIGDLFGIPHYDEDGTAHVVNRTPIAMVAPAPQKTAEQVAAEDERKAKALVQVWEESFALSSTEAAIGRSYLTRRSLNDVVGPLQDVRFHPSLEYRDRERKVVGHFPALLGLLTQSTGKPLTIQRIYLTPNGDKAPVEAAKKFMPFRSGSQYHGSAVRLDHDIGPVLCVGEGLETMLAWRAMTGLPSWACCVEQLLSNLMIPDQVRVLVVAADKDPVKGENPDGVGQMAAQALVERVRATGRKAAMILPPLPLEEGADKGPDWADVLKAHGLEAARRMPFAVGVRKQVREMVEEMGRGWDSVHSHF